LPFISLSERDRHTGAADETSRERQRHTSLMPE
jgi:hypothetical protein